MKKIMDVELYTVDEVAKMMGVCVQTVRRKIKNGEMCFCKIGHNHYVSSDAIRDYLNGEG